MVIKKYMICESCKSYVDFYIHEDEPIKNINVSCKCGKKYTCTDENKYYTTWKEINQEE